MTLPAEPFRRTVSLPDLAATAALGRRIAAGLLPGTAVALKGDLGAGKTALARAVLAALGGPDAVPSPSFSLVQRYDTPQLAITHADLYRIEHDAELEELGLDEALETGALLLEWPERAGPWLPDDTLEIHLESPSQGARLAHMTGPARWAEIFDAE